MIILLAVYLGIVYFISIGVGLWLILDKENSAIDIVMILLGIAMSPIVAPIMMLAFISEKLR